MGRRGARSIQRHVRFWFVGSAEEGITAGARSLRHQAALLRTTGKHLRVRFGNQGAAVASVIYRKARSGSAAGILHVSEFLYEQNPVRRHQLVAVRLSDA